MRIDVFHLLFGRIDVIRDFMLCISFGGGSTSGSSNTTNIPSWAKTYFQGFIPGGESALTAYNQGGGADSALSQQGATTLGQEVSGANLNPNTNPAFQNIEQATQQQAQQQFQSDVNQIGGQASQTGAYGSSGVPAAEAEAAQQLATGVAGVTSQAGMQDYLTNLGIQSQAVPQAQQYNLQNLNTALQVANLLRGSTSSTGTESVALQGGFSI